MTQLGRLRRRPLVVLYLVLSLVPLIALSSLAVLISTDAVTRRANQSLTLSASITARYVGDQIFGLEGIVSSFAQKSEITSALADSVLDPNERPRVEIQMAQLTTLRPGIAEALLLDRQGTQLAGVPYDGSFTRQTAAAVRSWSSQVTQTNRPFISPVYVSSSYGNPLVTAIAAPVAVVGGDGSTGPVLGVLAIEYSVNTVQQFSGQIAEAQGVDITIDDQVGNVVAEPSSGESTDIQPVLAQYLGQRGNLQTSGYLIAYAPIKFLGWEVGAELPASAALGDLSSLRLTVVAFAAPLALVLLAGAWLLDSTLRSWEHAEAEVRRLAAVDPLTGIYNRRSWDEHLERELARARRERRPLSVVMIDLDHFKQYNDEHGHPAGDRFLVATTSAWRSIIRATDVLARYGGEEFSVALSDCSLDDAMLIADRLRTSVPQGESCSAGVACWDGSESGAALVGRADHALYQAKKQGRNRIVVADSSAAAA